MPRLSGSANASDQVIMAVQVGQAPSDLATLLPMMSAAQAAADPLISSRTNSFFAEGQARGGAHSARTPLSVAGQCRAGGGR